jgi:hypothetical protein
MDSASLLQLTRRWKARERVTRMCVRKKTYLVQLIVLLTMALPVSGAPRKPAKKDRPKEVSTGPAVMWNDPKDLKSRDLFYGPGGKEHAPKGAFTFVGEDHGGGSPKFVVRDDEGWKWKAKLGLEARPETVCTRLLWAVGYYTDEDYFVRELKVSDMPPKLHRGQEFVDTYGSVHNVRLEREDEKIGIWQWRHDAFTDTRELNGLRVLMALINNWDLKDVNNAIYQVGPDRVYTVSDLGASLGSAGRTWPPAKGKDNLDSYRKSKFIRRLTADSVDFAVPARPTWKFWVDPLEVIRRIHLEWIGRNVPRADAKWIGELLARLSPQQIRDAFRAGGYSPEETEQFANVLQGRISILTDL